MVSCMFSACFLYTLPCIISVLIMHGYSKKRLQSLMMLPFCKATIKLVYTMHMPFLGSTWRHFLLPHTLLKANYKTLSLKVVLYQSLPTFDLVIIREFKFALKLQQCWTRTDLRCKAMKCKRK